MRVLLHGMYGCGNVGDELVCHATRQGLADAAARAGVQMEFTALSRRPEQSARFLPDSEIRFVRGGALHPLNLLGAWPSFRLIAGHDVVVAGGGGLVKDMYSWVLPLHTLWHQAVAVAMGKRAFCCGIGVGPLKGRWLQNACRNLFPQLDLVAVRDSESIDWLRRLGIGDDKGRLTCDVAAAIAARLGGDAPTTPGRIVFILRQWKDLEPARLAGLIGELVERGKHVELHGYEPPDRRLFEQAVSACTPAAAAKVTIREPKTLRDAVDSVAAAELIVSMRYHGCILSGLIGKPFVPVFYEQKLRGLVEQLDIADRIVDTHALGPELARRLCDDEPPWQDANASKLQERFDALIAANRRMFDDVVKRLIDQDAPDAARRCKAARRAALLTAHAAAFSVKHILSFGWLRRRLSKIGRTQ